MNLWHIRQAARVVRGGGIVAYPTEAVYGLGCDPLDPFAVLRILALKNRSLDEGLILIAARFDQLEPFLVPLDAETRKRVAATWPGPVTWLLPARPETPEWLTGRHDTLAVRVTAHPQAAALADAADTALVSTSANVSGRRPARSAVAARRMFGDAVDYYLAGEVGGLAQPTEIRDGGTGRVVRPGPG